MIHIAVWCSTRGTDLQAIIDAIADKILKNVDLALVFCNKECGAAERARGAGITTRVLESKGKDRHAYYDEVLSIMRAHKIDLICLAGYMHIIPPNVIDAYKNRIMNVHPSLLPAFAGGMDMNVHAEVLKSGATETGCTIHFVTEKPDSGPIILQEKVSVTKEDTPETLKEKVQEKEKICYIKAIQLFANGKLKVAGEKVTILK